MSDLNIIQHVFGRLYGQPCWGVKLGHASFLTLEFGEPRLEIGTIRQVGERPPRRTVAVRGAWHLWVYCCEWSIRLDGLTLATSASSERKADMAIAHLDGQALARVSVAPDGGRSALDFDLGGS